MRIPAYVTNADFENYVFGWTTSDPTSLTDLLFRAEGYVDPLGATRPLGPADAVQQIATSGNPTGGNFTLQFVLAGDTYTTGVIPARATRDQAVSAVAAATNLSNGAKIPASIIGSDDSGPLPYPITFAFIGSASGMAIPAGAVAVNSLTGGTAPSPLITQLCPGTPGGRRFNPSDLLNNGQLQALKNAVCAQAQYLLTMDDKLFDGAQYSKIKGPVFTTEGRVPTTGPKVLRELSAAGLQLGLGRTRQ